MKIGIVGGGVFGTAAAWELTKRGHNVQLFERGAIPAEDASSTDYSKVIRLEYGPASALYTPLVERAFARWSELEELVNDRFLHLCGVLFLVSSQEESRFEAQSAKFLAGTAYAPQWIEAPDAQKRWPQFAWKAMQGGFFNPKGGWIESTRAVQAMAKAAQAAGAELHPHTPVLGLEDGKIRLEDKTLAFDQILVCAGPWVNQLLPALQTHARVSRQQIAFYQPQDPGPFHESRFPVWIYDMREEGWYGFPTTQSGLVKISLHRRSETVHPDISRQPTTEYLAMNQDFVRQAIPALAPDSLAFGKVCLYTNSKNGDLMLDHAPGFERVYVAGLGSGHGFKFGPVLGELAANLMENDEIPQQLRLQTSFQGEVW